MPRVEPVTSATLPSNRRPTPRCLHSSTWRGHLVAGLLGQKGLKSRCLVGSGAATVSRLLIMSTTFWPTTEHWSCEIPLDTPHPRLDALAARGFVQLSDLP